MHARRMYIKDDSGEVSERLGWPWHSAVRRKGAWDGGMEMIRIRLQKIDLAIEMDEGIY